MKKRWTVNFYRQYKRFDILPSILIEYSKWLGKTRINILFSWLIFECSASKFCTKKDNHVAV
jgi:hypothetical protein